MNPLYTAFAWAMFSMTLGACFGAINFHQALIAPWRKQRIAHAVACVMFGVLFLLAARLAITVWSLL
jgi:hypothetical protein